MGAAGLLLPKGEVASGPTCRPPGHRAGGWLSVQLWSQLRATSSEKPPRPGLLQPLLGVTTACPPPSTSITPRPVGVSAPPQRVLRAPRGAQGEAHRGAQRKVFGKDMLVLSAGDPGPLGASTRKCCPWWGTLAEHRNRWCELVGCSGVLAGRGGHPGKTETPLDPHRTERRARPEPGRVHTCAHMCTCESEVCTRVHGA